MDPHELLKLYREDPGSLKIADSKIPNKIWMPPEAQGPPPMQTMSRYAALRALAGNQNWKESPTVEALKKQEQSKQKVKPLINCNLKNEDDLEDFLENVREAVSS